MELNDDLLLEVFTKLPAGLIPRLKCVCRNWYALLSSPWLRAELFPQSTMSGFYVDSFFNKFGLHPEADNDPHPACFAAVTGDDDSDDDNDDNDDDDSDDDDCRRKKDVSFSYFPTDPQSEERIRILHVSDGLLLCKYKTRTTATFVTNPITRSYEVLPPIPEPNGFRVYDMILGFDRSKDGDNYVVLANLKYSSIHSTYVFSRRIGKWMPFDYEHQQGKGETSGRPFTSSTLNQKVLYADGVFFFYQFRYKEDEYMFAVDIDKGLIREVKVPLKSEQSDLYRYYVGKKSDGRLVFGGFRCTDRSKELPEAIRSSRFQMWMLEDVRGEQWELKINVDLGNSIPTLDYLDLQPYYFFEFRVVAFHPDYEIVFFTTRPFGYLFAFSMRSKNITRICCDLPITREFLVYAPLWVDIFAKQSG